MTMVLEDLINGKIKSWINNNKTYAELCYLVKDNAQFNINSLNYFNVKVLVLR